MFCQEMVSGLFSTFTLAHASTQKSSKDDVNDPYNVHFRSLRVNVTAVVCPEPRGLDT